MTKNFPLISQSSPEPLTYKNTQGTVHQRMPEVEQQIISCLVLSDSEIIDRAQYAQKESSDYLQEETLVYLIRRSAQNHNSILYGTLAEVLLIRCVEEVSYYLRSLDRDIAQDANNETIQRLLEKIVTPDPKNDFLQVRFWRALKFLLIDVFRKYQKGFKDDRKFLHPRLFKDLTELGNDDDWEDTVSDENKQLSIEQISLVKEAVGHLEEPVRTAFILCHYAGWQIESKDSEEITISKYFQKDGRTIRNWLKKAENDLKKWRGGHDG